MYSIELNCYSHGYICLLQVHHTLGSLNPILMADYEKHSSCFICGSQQINPVKGYYERKGIVKCQNCDFIFMERIPTEKELNDHYSKYAYASEGYISPLTIQSFNLLLDELEPYRKNNRLLDVGCGRGDFLVEARKRGWEVSGTEYSETAVALCESKGITMKKGQLNSADFDVADFDVIVSFEVIEHIINPNEELKHMHALLRKGGLFYCTTPNFNSLNRYYQKAEFNIIEYPEHLSYYTKKTLVDVAKRHGLKKVGFRSTGISITRIRNSKKKGTEAMCTKESTDEKLRETMSSGGIMSFVKKSINWLLTLTNTGITLKGYFMKV